MPHRRTCRNFAQRAWAIWDLSNHDLFLIISDPGSQQRVTLLQTSISTIPFQTGASDVKMPKLRQHSSNRGMRCWVYVFSTFRATSDQADEDRGALGRFTGDICSNIRYHEIVQPGMPIARKIRQVSFVGCTNDWHNCCRSRKLILGSHRQSHVFILLLIRRPSESARHSGSISRGACKGRYTRRNWIQLKISL